RSDVAMSEKQPVVSERDNPQISSRRLLPVDLLRGWIIVFMALDHASYFAAHQHSSGEYWGGPMPVFASTLAFLTRLVTHFCAPGFFFLMGAGMALFAESRRTKGWSEARIIQHFAIRGGFLIALQLLLINHFWQLGPFPFPSIYIGVLIALGGGMILGSFMLRFKPLPLLLGALVLFLGTELLHPEPSFWNLLETDPLNLVLLRSGGTDSFWSNYPILPWLELIVFGIVFGGWLHTNQKQAYKRAAYLGLIFLALFLGLRLLNGFGNIRPRVGDGWMDFLTLVKYPPSMTFTLFSMGGNLLLLWVFSRLPECVLAFLGPLAVFGQAPLFFYILHLPLYILLGGWLTPGGSSLGIMFLIWLFGLVILYPLTWMYTRLKRSQPPESLLRFL
ncbi:MAG: heparan-alpha-glucosaminide N-acetyltransferase domain-containing protein, partial [Anaerolineales bacterium]|nr:heparan-alpha-glucosaminide N-acetyltransferase domain-containing protein [Anaerolineales bacterium]